MKISQVNKMRIKELFRLWVAFILIVVCISALSLTSFVLFLNMKMKQELYTAVKPCIDLSASALSSDENKSARLLTLRKNVKVLSKKRAISKIQIRDTSGKVIVTEKSAKGEPKGIFKLTYKIKDKKETVAFLDAWFDYGYGMKKHLPVSLIAIAAIIILMLTVTLILLLIDFKILQPLRLAAVNIDKILDWDSRKIKTDTSIKRVKRFEGKTSEVVEIMSETQEILNMLFDISRKFISNMGLFEILNGVLDIIRNRFDSISAAILELEEDGFLRIKNNRGFSREFIRTVKVKVGEGVLGKVHESARSAIINDISRQGDPFTQEMEEQEHFKSILYIPLVLEHMPMGVLMIASKHRSYFDFRRVKTLTMIAESTSITMRNARLYEQLQSFNRRLEGEVSSTTQELTQTNTRLIKKVRELKALYDIAFATAKHMDMEEVLELIIERVQDILNVECINFVLYNEKSNELEVKKLVIRGRVVESGHKNIRMIDSGILTHVFKGGDAYLSNKLVKEENVNLGLPEDYSLKSILAVPLKTKYKTTGLFCFGNKIDSPFNDDDIRLVTVLCNQTAEVIENIKLYQENKRRVQDLTTLHEISFSVSSSIGLQDMLKRISSIIKRELNADTSIFLLHNEASKELIVQEGSSLLDDGREFNSRVDVANRKSHSSNVFRMGEPMLLANISVPQSSRNDFEKDLNSLIVIPLKVENKILGILHIGSKEEKHFEFEQMRLGVLIADQTAAIIDKAKLYEKLGDAIKELQNINNIKNEFIVSVVNELRIPIDALKGFLGIVLNSEAGPVKPKQKHFLGLADRSISRLDVLTKDLLDISRVESGLLEMKMVPSFLPDILNKAVSNLVSEMEEKKQNMVLEISQDIPKLNVDPDRIGQVFENILSNAVKFTPKKGTITIKAGIHEDSIKVVISDTGIGVPAKDHKKIFEKFYQIEDPMHKELRGTGLGLSLVKSIVKLHKGDILLKSEMNEGSEFIVVLPAK